MTGDLTNLFNNIFVTMMLTIILVAGYFALRAGLVAFYKYRNNLNEAEYAYVQRRKRLSRKIRDLEHRPDENAAELETLRGRLGELDEIAKNHPKIHYRDVVGLD